MFTDAIHLLCFGVVTYKAINIHAAIDMICHFSPTLEQAHMVTLQMRLLCLDPHRIFGYFWKEFLEPNLQNNAA